MAAMNPASVLSCFFFFSLAVILPTLQGHNFTLDDYWQKRFLEAQLDNIKAYHPNPEDVTDHFNHHVFMAVHGGNTTRRNLGSKKLDRFKQGCKATNPIDKCWRCDKNWDKNRQKLTECILGFGRNTIGGKKGRIYVVNDASDHLMDPRPGTLRHAVTRSEPLWIIFSRDMIIKLQDELIMTSHKTINGFMTGHETIDGRGANVHIAFGAGITIQAVRNIIITNVHIHDVTKTKGAVIRDSDKHWGRRDGADGDGITIFGGSDVWIDHVSMYNCGDGLIDVTMGATAITISNSHFTRHNDVMLFSAHNQDVMDKKMQITVAFNHFGKGLVQRMPRCRFGFFHLVNNDYTHWNMYAIGGNMNPTIISQGNRFKAPPNDAIREVTKREEHSPPSEWKQWTWRSERDLMMNKAFFVESGNPRWNWPAGSDKMRISPMPGAMVPELTKDAGTLICRPGQPC